MVARIKGDMDKVDRQLCEAEATVETTMPAPALRSFVPYIFVSTLDISKIWVWNKNQLTFNSDETIALASFQRYHFTRLNMNHLFISSQNPRSIMEPSTSSMPDFEPVPLFSTEEFFKENAIIKTKSK